MLFHHISTCELHTKGQLNIHSNSNKSLHNFMVGFFRGGFIIIFFMPFKSNRMTGPAGVTKQNNIVNKKIMKLEIFFTPLFTAPAKRVHCWGAAKAAEKNEMSSMCVGWPKYHFSSILLSLLHLFFHFYSARCGWARHEHEQTRASSLIKTIKKSLINHISRGERRLVCT